MIVRSRALSVTMAVTATTSLASLSGCYSTSIGGDTRQVRQLADVEDLPALADIDVDPEAAKDARTILDAPLDADAAVRVAILGNRELRATLRRLGVIRGRIKQAGLLPNPLLEAELLPERNSEVELRVEYDISSLLLAPRRRRAMEPELAAARHRAAAAVLELGYRVRSAFYRYQAAQQRLAVAQQMLDAHAAARDASEAMLAAGNIPALDRAQREAAYQRARITVAELELELAGERESLHRLFGVHGEDTEWTATGSLPAVPDAPPDVSAVETRALRASLDLAGTRDELEALARRTGVTRLEGWLPDVAFDVHALYGSPEDEAGASGDDVRFGGGVSLTVPLFDRKQGASAAYEAEFDALAERYYGMAIDLRSAARQARNRVVSAHGRALQYQQVIVPAQAQVTEQTLLQYNAMQVGIFQLLQVRRDELSVQLAYVETLQAYWSAVAALDALLAGAKVGGEDRGTMTAFDAASGEVGGH